MFTPAAHHFLLLWLALPAFWASAWVGAYYREKRGNLKNDHVEDFRFIIGATFTLLGLIVAFTFSMAVNRYDQRKNFEEQEANAIGTEFVRASLLSAADAANVRALLNQYVAQRILFYKTSDEQRLQQINDETAKLQNQLWSSVDRLAAAQQTPVMALVVAGMNDVLNSQGYTQAAYWNRIPAAAWMLIIIISVFCNLLIGFGMRSKNALLLLILPIILSVSLFLIADIDSPRRGLIEVLPQNLQSLADSLRAQ